LLGNDFHELSHLVRRCIGPTEVVDAAIERSDAYFVVQSGLFQHQHNRMPHGLLFRVGQFEHAARVRVADELPADEHLVRQALAIGRVSARQLFTIVSLHFDRGREEGLRWLRNEV